MNKVIVKDLIINIRENEFISLTDIVKSQMKITIENKKDISIVLKSFRSLQWICVKLHKKLISDIIHI